jgi:hypothetical protein
MANENTASSAIWAIVTLLIVVIIAAMLYFGGAFSNKKEIDIKIDRPGMVLTR